LARAAEAREVLPRELAEAGAEITEVTLYRTLPPDGLTLEAAEALEAGEIDLVTFTSSSTVTNLVTLLGRRLNDFRDPIPAAVIGPVTGRTAREAGFKVAAEAREHTVDGLVQAMVDHYSS
ncbi:MAG: uroporphyrinogen-III synthase, partial [Pseudomonadota bacterium]